MHIYLDAPWIYELNESEPISFPLYMYSYAIGNYQINHIDNICSQIA